MLDPSRDVRSHQMLSLFLPCTYSVIPFTYERNARLVPFCSCLDIRDSRSPVIDAADAPNALQTRCSV